MRLGRIAAVLIGFFFFQAEDGIRDKLVTGVQTCALPICVSRGLQDLPFGELRDEIQRLRDTGIYPAAALMEAHQRVAASVACVAFTLIGIPLGIKTSRRETSIGIAVSLGLALIWYLMLVLSSTLRNRPYLFPEAILWTPNLIFEVLGVWLLWRVSRV